MTFQCRKCGCEFEPSFEEDSELIENGYSEPICDDCAEDGEFSDEIEDIEHYSFFDQDLGF